MSVFPVSANTSRITPHSVSLQAANGTSIPTLGAVTVPLRFPGLSTQHSFLLADIPRPILGADFFSKHDLLIDISSQRLLRCPPHDSALLSPLEPVQARAVSLSGDVCGLRAEKNNPVEELLKLFPGISVSHYDQDAPPAHGIFHTVPTTGAPVFARARRLMGAKLEAARTWHLAPLWRLSPFKPGNC